MKGVAGFGRTRIPLPPPILCCLQGQQEFRHLLPSSSPVTILIFCFQTSWSWNLLAGSYFVGVNSKRGKETRGKIVWRHESRLPSFKFNTYDRLYLRGRSILDEFRCLTNGVKHLKKKLTELNLTVEYGLKSKIHIIILTIIDLILYPEII